MDILASGYSGMLHVGVTSNLVGRVMQHRAESFGGSSQRYCSTHLVYFEVADDMVAAITPENQVKRFRRDWKRNLIERDNPRWDDRAVGFGLEPLLTE